MKKIFFFLFSIFIVFSSNATHLMGGQITASYLSSDSTGSHYIFELTAYRDTIGIPMGISAVFDIESYDTSNGTWNSLQTYTVTYDTSSGNLLPTVTVYGVEVYSFLDTITLPGNGYYSISWSECCRNAAIVNMYSPLSENLHLTTYLTVDNLNPNSSPTFLTPPVAYLPHDTIWQYNPLPFDPDGDSLVWSLVTPLHTSSVQVSGYEYLSDSLYSDTTGIFTLDSITGSISWDPRILGNFAASLIIEEFRNGSKIGEMRRDMQFIVINDTSNFLPIISNFQTIPTNSLGYPYVLINPGTNYQLHLIGNDVNPNDILSMQAFGEVFGLFISPASFNYINTGNGNEIQGTFSWTPDLTHVRPQSYITVFRTSDNLFYFDNTIQFEVTLGSTNLNEENLHLNKLYPNPSNGNFLFSLNLKNPKNIEINIFNMMGVEIYHKDLKLTSGNHIIQNKIDLKNGYYLLKISDEQNVIKTSKILIIK
jgi:hypothetical protein